MITPDSLRLVEGMLQSMITNWQDIAPNAGSKPGNGLGITRSSFDLPEHPNLLITMVRHKDCDGYLSLYVQDDESELVRLNVPPIKDGCVSCSVCHEEIVLSDIEEKIREI